MLSQYIKYNIIEIIEEQITKLELKTWLAHEYVVEILPCSFFNTYFSCLRTNICYVFVFITK